MKTNNRVVIIGIDGVPYGLIHDLAKEGIMPNFNELLGDGIFNKMRSSIPEISSVAWSSIITGVNPGVHGIFGFTDLLPNSYSLRFPNYRNLKVPAFWEIQNDLQHLILNVPSTYPAKELSGIHIAGFVAPDMNKAVYPPDLLPILQKYDYRIDVDASKAQKSNELFLKDLLRTLDARTQIFNKLWEKDWDTFMAVFTSSDRLEHFLWDAHLDPEHQYHDSFNLVFQRIDEAIGQMVAKMTDSDQLVILSDHGMELTDLEVNINNVLIEEGYLKLGSDPKKRYGNITEESVAFALDPARIYLNRKNKYPKGFVSPSVEEELLKQLIEIFSDLKYQGKRVIKNIYAKEEIYQGSCLPDAPDLVLTSHSGFNLRGKIDRKSIFESPSIVGKHTLDDAFLYVQGKEYTNHVPSNPNVENIVSIMNLLRDQ